MKIALFLGLSFLMCGLSANAARISLGNAEKIASIVGDVAFMTEIEDSLKSFESEDSLSLSSIKWMGLQGGALTGKVEYTFFVEYKALITGSFPADRCVIKVVLTEYLDQRPSTKNFDPKCLPVPPGLM